jgi:hypothetical protein
VEAYSKWAAETSLVEEARATDSAKAGSEADALVVKPTMLYSRKVDVEGENAIELEKLPYGPVTWNATDAFTAIVKKTRKESYVQKMDDAIPPSVTIKVGAQVMLKANVDVSGGLANGSRGVVVRSTYPHGVYVKWMSGLVTLVVPFIWDYNDKYGRISRSQIPLILAWAFTIHKSQSTTLDYAIVNLGTSIFLPGQAYVALSRVRSGRGLFIEELVPRVITCNQDALTYVDSLVPINDSEVVEAEVEDVEAEVVEEAEEEEAEVVEEAEEDVEAEVVEEEEIEIKIVYVLKFPEH